MQPLELEMGIKSLIHFGNKRFMYEIKDSEGLVYLVRDKVRLVTTPLVMLRKLTYTLQLSTLLLGVIHIGRLGVSDCSGRPIFIFY